MFSWAVQITAQLFKWCNLRRISSCLSLPGGTANCIQYTRSPDLHPRTPRVHRTFKRTRHPTLPRWFFLGRNAGQQRRKGSVWFLIYSNWLWKFVGAWRKIDQLGNYRKSWNCYPNLQPYLCWAKWEGKGYCVVVAVLLVRSPLLISWGKILLCENGTWTVLACKLSSESVHSRQMMKLAFSTCPDNAALDSRVDSLWRDGHNRHHGTLWFWTMVDFETLKYIFLKKITYFKFNLNYQQNIVISVVGTILRHLDNSHRQNWSIKFPSLC